MKKSPDSQPGQQSAINDYAVVMATDGHGIDEVQSDTDLHAVSDSNEVLPEGEVITQILNKVREGIERSIHVGRRIWWATETGRITFQAIPFPYRYASYIMKKIKQDIQQSGVNLDFNSEEFINLIIDVIREKGGFTREELAFLEENRLDIRKIINISNTSEGEQDSGKLPVIDDFYESIKEGILGLKKRVTGKAQTQETIETISETSAQAPIVWSDLNDMDLLNINIHELAKMFFEDHLEFTRIMWNNSDPKFSSDEAKAEHLRRVGKYGGEIPNSAILKHEMRKQRVIMKKANKVWKAILEIFYAKQENADENMFCERVNKCTNIFDLHLILRELNWPANLTKEKLKEIDDARVKLALFLAISKVSENKQYRFKESVKKYWDDLLTREIFEMTGTKMIQMPYMNEQGKWVQTTKRMKLITAILIDPDGEEEPMEVHLYPGGDSEKPRARQEGIVNLKGLAKRVMKYFVQEGKESIDDNRITVMPANSTSEKDLEKMRRILRKSLLHRRGLHSITLKEEKNNGKSDNPATGFKERDVISYQLEVTPKIWVKGQIREGYIRDSRVKGRLLPIDRTSLEVTTGLERDLLSGKHPEDPSYHDTYSRGRIIGPFIKMRNPEIYLENWIGRAHQYLESLHKRLNKGENTLSEFVLTKILGKYLSGMRTTKTKEREVFTPSSSQ